MMTMTPREVEQRNGAPRDLIGLLTGIPNRKKKRNKIKKKKRKRKKRRKLNGRRKQIMKVRRM